MITPPSLKHGDTIGLIATARKISRAEMEPAIQQLKNWGLEVELGKNIFRQQNQFSGTDAERASDLQSMLDNPEIKAIICGRGGYGTLRIIDHLDFSAFSKKPKWI